MLRSLLVVALAGATVLGSALSSQAAEGRKKSLAAGVAIGAVGAVAAGVIASKMMGSGQPAPVAEEPPPRRGYGYDDGPRARPVGFRDEQRPRCRTAPTRLFTEDGTYVKTERLEICR